MQPLCRILGSGAWNDFAMVGDEARVVQAFCVWLVEHGWETQLEVEHVDVVANRAEQRLYAEAKGRTSAVGLDLDTLYGQLHLNHQPGRHRLAAIEGAPARHGRVSGVRQIRSGAIRDQRAG